MAEETSVVEQVAETPENVETTETNETEGQVVEGTENTEVNPEEGEPQENHATRRWKKLINDRAEATAEARFWRMKAEELEKTKGGSDNKAQPAPQSTRPQRSQFKTDEEFNNAVMDYVDAKSNESSEKAKQQVIAEQINKVWNEKLDNAKAAHVDYQEVIDNSEVAQMPLTNTVVDAIKRSDNGPELTYYFAKNPEVIEKINKMEPYEAVLAIGKISAKLESAPVTKTVTKKGAPAPINPVRPKGVAVNKDPSKMTKDEWYKWREQQIELEKKNKRR